jgi:prevent-host-death family protein
MPRYNVAEAKARFSELVRRAVSGEEVIVARDNKPLLKLVPVAMADGQRAPGTARGRIWVSPDFDQPLPDFDEYS